MNKIKKFFKEYMFDLLKFREISVLDMIAFWAWISIVPSLVEYGVFLMMVVAVCVGFIWEKISRKLYNKFVEGK